MNLPGVAEAGPALERPNRPVYLLDVNVLLALVDPMHGHHGRAHAWFADQAAGGWASCAVTQNGAILILAQPRYPNRVDSVAAAVAVIDMLCRHPGHVWWPGTLSLLDPAKVDRRRLLSPGQVTDSYLLALAVVHGGRLASFDRRLVADAVHGGRETLQLID